MVYRNEIYKLGTPDVSKIAVVSDVDGTIVQTENAELGLGNQSKDALDLVLPIKGQDSEQYKQNRWNFLTSQNYNQINEFKVALSKLRIPNKSVDAIFNEFIQNLCDLTQKTRKEGQNIVHDYPIFEDWQKMAVNLHNAGFKMGANTNNFEEVMNTVFQTHGLDEIVPLEHRISAFTNPNVKLKSDPSSIFAIAQQMNVEIENIVFLGDTKSDAGAMKNALQTKGIEKQWNNVFIRPNTDENWKKHGLKRNKDYKRVNSFEEITPERIIKLVSLKKNR